jgi:farnesyl-diphosphate farnesyltransferase
MQDFDLYTHYVAGLVGIGLTGLFQESGLEDRLVGNDIPEISNQMGLFLQKINILKDFLADAQGEIYFAKNRRKIVLASTSMEQICISRRRY